MASLPLSAQAAFKKTAGILTLTDSLLSWTPTTPAGPKSQAAFSEATSKILALFASKPETGKHNLKLTFYPSSPLTGDKGVTLNFTHPSTAQDDAAKIKGILASAAAQNRVDKAGPPEVQPRPPALGAVVEEDRKPVIPSVSAGHSSASSSTASSSKTAAVAGPSSTTTAQAAAVAKAKGKNLKEDWDLHKRVLVKNPELAELHYQLVQTGPLTDDEFWEGRELLLTSETLSSQQRPGRPSRLIDDRWASAPTSSSTTSGTGQGTTKSASKGGAATISLTPDLIRDIFDEFPDVHLAWKQNVPKVVTEPVFWQRYFNSKLWERHRASARSSGKGTAKPDEMFDKYLGELDDGLVPKNESSEVVNRFLDLAASEFDHEDTGNARDVTMQAGKERASLPLMRRFNEHSEKLLKASESSFSSLATASTPHAGADDRIAKRARLEPSSHQDRDQIRFAEIDLPELNTVAAPSPIELDLDVVQRRGLFEGSGAVGTDSDGSGEIKRKRTQEELGEIEEEARRAFGGWRAVLNAVKLEKKVAEDVMVSLTVSVRSRLDAKSDKATISSQTLRDLHVLHTTTTEFLRQLYTSILPSAPTPTSTVSASGSTTYHLGAKLTEGQKKEKAEKMVGYLRKTKSKADVLEEGCATEEERVRVKGALKITLESVDKALAFYQSKKK